MSATTPGAAPAKGLALPAMGAPMLEVRDLSKVYRVGESRLAALNRVTLCTCGGSRNKPLCDGTHRLTQEASLRREARLKKQ